MPLGQKIAVPVDPAREAAIAARQRERMEMVEGAAQGWEMVAIVGWRDRIEATVRQCRATYQAVGIDALADAPRGGLRQR